MPPLESLQWQNRFQSLGDSYFQRVRPTPLYGARLVSANVALARSIGLHEADVTSKRFVRLMNGEERLEQFDEIATVYSGHQFGTYVSELGDGRAILFGEAERYEWQVKGAGLTRYSRMGDGRSVLRSALREYLASEALHALGVPTTRALAVIASDTRVEREKTETGALTVRLARSFIRFGHFEYFYHLKSTVPLRRLVDFTINEYFGESFVGRYDEWFREVVHRTARLMADWQAIGFCHGVMNSDNFSILGDTLDYGPFGFVERFDAHHVCNHSDDFGRYAFSAQPEIAFFNLRVLAQALTPVVSERGLRAALSSYGETFEAAYRDRMFSKLGLSCGELQADLDFVSSLLQALHDANVDYTNFFRRLGAVLSMEEFGLLFDDLGARDATGLLRFAHEYLKRLDASGMNAADRQREMNEVNPKVVPRNHWLQFLIEEAEAGRYDDANDALARLTRPFDDVKNEINERFLRPLSSDEQAVEVSCSS